MKKEYIIPIIISKDDFNKNNILKTKTDIKQKIENYLDNFNDDNKFVDVALYSENFSEIEKENQIELLEEINNNYIKNKKVNSIRILLNPNDINRKYIKILKKFNVSTIELIAPSTNDYILKKSNYNFNFVDIKKASKLIRFYRLNLGFQMKVGLFDSTEKDDIKTANDLIILKPKMVRISPEFVLKKTDLAKEYAKGEYTPLTLDQAVQRIKEIIYIFRKNNIDNIKIGLQNSDEDDINYIKEYESKILAGPFQVNLRELVESEMWYDSISEKIKNINSKVRKVSLVINEEDYNNVIGTDKKNIIRIKDIYGIDIIIKTDNSIQNGDFRIVEE